MRLSHERCVHLSHRVIDAIEDDDRFDIKREPNEIRLKVLQILEFEMVKQDQIEETVRHRITSQKREIPMGSPEWDVLFRKYYEEEVAKIKRVRE
jgi:hypothetical protein